MVVRRPGNKKQGLSYLCKNHIFVTWHLPQVANGRCHPSSPRPLLPGVQKEAARVTHRMMAGRYEVSMRLALPKMNSSNNTHTKHKQKTNKTVLTSDLHFLHALSRFQPHVAFDVLCLRRLLRATGGFFRSRRFRSTGAARPRPQWCAPMCFSCSNMF